MSKEVSWGGSTSDQEASFRAMSNWDETMNPLEGLYIPSGLEVVAQEVVWATLGLYVAMLLKTDEFWCFPVETPNLSGGSRGLEGNMEVFHIKVNTYWEQCEHIYDT